MKHVILILRVLNALTGLYQVFFGEIIIGVYILLALAAITLPAKITRNYIISLPLEFEFLFSLMILLQLVIGETLNAYYVLPFYDKFIHFTVPLYLGIMGFLLAYTMTVAGKLKMTVGPLVLIIVLLTQGIGASWEIIEYLYDQFVYPYYDGLGMMQGSLIESPYADTMHDLIADFLGGIFGAVIGLRYVQLEKNATHSRLSAIVNQLALNFQLKPTGRIQRFIATERVGQRTGRRFQSFDLQTNKVG